MRACIQPSQSAALILRSPTRCRCPGANGGFGNAKPAFGTRRGSVSRAGVGRRFKAYDAGICGIAYIKAISGCGVHVAKKSHPRHARSALRPGLISAAGRTVGLIGSQTKGRRAAELYRGQSGECGGTSNQGLAHGGLSLPAKPFALPNSRILQIAFIRGRLNNARNQ